MIRNSWGDKQLTHTHTHTHTHIHAHCRNSVSLSLVTSCNGFVLQQMVTAVLITKVSTVTAFLKSAYTHTHTHTHKLMHACIKHLQKAQGLLKYKQHVPSKRKQPSLHRHIINMLTQAFLHDIASLNLSYEVILPCFAHVRTQNWP